LWADAAPPPSHTRYTRLRAHTYTNCGALSWRWRTALCTSFRDLPLPAGLVAWQHGTGRGLVAHLHLAAPSLPSSLLHASIQLTSLSHHLPFLPFSPPVFRLGTLCSYLSAFFWWPSFSLERLLGCTFARAWFTFSRPRSAPIAGSSLNHALHPWLPQP